MKVIATHLREDGSREKFLTDGWPDPEKPGPGQFLTRTLYTGLTNGSERNDLTRGNYANPDEKLPATWGYQNVGEVIEVGEGVEEYKVGDVLYMSHDHVQSTLVGSDFLMVKLPAEVEPAQAALFGMASVAMRTCRNADVRMGEKVLVVGAGFIGQIAAQISNAMGGRVTIVDIDDKRLEKAHEVGAVEHAFNTAGDGWEKHVEEFGYEVVIDLAGVPGMEDRLISAAKPRGRVMLIAGRFNVNYTFNTGQIHEITLKQNSHFDNDDLARLCHLVAKGSVTIGPLLQQVVPAAEAKKIYDTLRDDPAQLGGIVFDWKDV